MKTLLSGQLADGGFGVHPYQKWTGAHWRLVSLVELGILPGNKQAVRATNGVLEWLTGQGHLNGIKTINGLTRRCASQEGNALAVCSRLGIAEDPRVRQLAESLVEWQWPDGGWNCDKREHVQHSSFNESLPPMWGLIEYYKVTGDKSARKAFDKTAGFFLKHSLFRSCRTGQVPSAHDLFLKDKLSQGMTLTETEKRWREKENSRSASQRHFAGSLDWLDLHYPPYWHYDILQALIVLSRADKLKDQRTKEALDILESKQQKDGSWWPDGYHWSLGRRTRAKVAGSNVEVVDWGRRGPNEMISLNALRVLRATGRFS